MKPSFSALLTGLAATLLANTASAIPIRFEFSGTTSLGQRAVGVINLETDGFYERFISSQPDPLRRYFYDTQESGARPIPSTASLSLDGQTFYIGNFPEAGFSDFSMQDVCTPDCVSNRRDAWALGIYEQSQVFTGTPPGFLSARQLSFFTQAEVGTDGFDLAGVSAESILTLPLLNQVRGYYAEEVFDCTGGPSACFRTEFRSHEFAVDSVVRSVDTRSVPEPGTLGLLGVALAGVFVSRRRKPGHVPR